MKKIVISLFALIFAAPAAFADTNPFMGEHENQIAFHLGQGVNSGFLIPPPTQFVPFYMLHIQYSQPTTFFKIPARQSINIGQTLGFGQKYGWNWDQYTIPMIFFIRRHCPGARGQLVLCDQYWCRSAGTAKRTSWRKVIIPVQTDWRIQNKRPMGNRDIFTAFFKRQHCHGKLFLCLLWPGRDI